MLKLYAHSTSTEGIRTPRSLQKIMFVTGRLNSEASGVTRIMCDLANALGCQNFPVSLYAADCPGMDNGSHLLDSPSQYISASGRWLGGLSFSPALRRQIEMDISAFQAVHSHSLWMLPNHYASVAARRRGIPVLFTAHGVFESWAIARSGWKKRVVAAWWQRKDLKEAACIHVNSIAEIEGVRAFGLCNPVAVVPNGVELAPFDQLPPRNRLHMRYPELVDKKVLLFLSRLHEKKGIRHLVEAWGRLTDDHRDWHLLIVGPDDGAEAAVRAVTSVNSLSCTMTLAGRLEGNDKLAAFATADAFVLPSFSEGFSMAILEALAARLPVILTPGCNFPEAVAAGAAIQVEPNAKDTERGLRELFSMTHAQRQEVGRRGRALVESRYTWDGVATQMIQLYRWMANGGAAPPFVQK